MRWLRLLCVLAALPMLAASPGLADDEPVPASTSTPNPTPTPESAATPTPTPEQVLEKLGLKRTRSTYSLVAESNVFAKRKEVQGLNERWQDAIARQRLVDQSETRIAELKQATVQLRRDVGSYDTTLQKMPRRGNNLVRANHQQTVAERDQLRAQLNGLNRELDQLRADPPTPKKKADAKAAVSSAREAHAAGVSELRSLVDAMVGKYGELSKDEDVKKALEAIGGKTRTTMRVAPSAEFKKTQAYLEQAERVNKPAIFGDDDKPAAAVKKAGKARRKAAAK